MYLINNNIIICVYLRYPRCLRSFKTASKNNVKYSVIALVAFFCFSCTMQKKPAVASQSDMPMDTAVAHIDETKFIEYLQTLSQDDQPAEKERIGIVLDKALNENPASFKYTVSLFEKYLYNPNSPLRNEELYLIVLQYICRSQVITEAEKIRYSSQLTMLSKNRTGEIATDFEYISATGKKEKLSRIHADYLIIFFNNPDCSDCVRVKKLLSSVNNSHVKILSIYPDSDLSVWKKTSYPSFWINGYNYETINQLYDLKAIPTLYLLDRNKRIILKDADVEEIIKFIGQI